MRSDSRATGTLRILEITCLAAIVVVFALFWAADASSATPTDVQYGAPTQSVSATTGPRGWYAEHPLGAAVNMLPATGGSLVFLCALGGLTFAGTGVLLWRRASRS